jgi:hypothetical protein
MDDITAAYAHELKTAVNGIEIRTPEHPADRAQRHRIERMAVGMIAFEREICEHLGAHGPVATARWPGP